MRQNQLQEKLQLVKQQQMLLLNMSLQQNRALLKSKTKLTTAWLAKLVRRQSAVREARVRFPARPPLRVLK